MPSRLLAALAVFSLAAAPDLSAASVRNRQIHQVDLRDIRANPESFQGLRVKFRAIFVQTAELFTPFHTPFTPERHINIVVWDDMAALWEPAVRADPVMNLYLLKDRLETSIIAALDRYTPIDITGEVISGYRGDPWIEISNIEVVTDVPPQIDQSIKQLQEAGQLHADGVYDQAEQNYVAVLARPLAQWAELQVRYLRAQNLFDARKPAACANEMDMVLSGLSNWSGEPFGLQLPQAQYLMARTQLALAELALAEDNKGMAAAHYQRAILEAERAITGDPTLGPAHAVLGIALAGINDFEAAGLRCARAVRMLPEDAEVRWYLGRIQHQQGDWNAAVETLKRAIDLAPKDARIHKSIAAVYFDRGRQSTPRIDDDVVMALREYDIAIRLNAADADCYYLSGLVLRYCAENGIAVRVGAETVPATQEMSVKRFISCLTVDDTYAPAHIALGEHYRKQEQHEDALGHYRRAVELRPHDLSLQKLLGAYLWERKKLSDAYTVYENMFTMVPSDVETLHALQGLASELDRPLDGVNWGTKLLAIDAQHVEGRVMHAELLERAGQTVVALAQAESVLADTTMSPERLLRARRAAALALFALDRPHEVVAMLKDVAFADLGAVRVRVALAWSLSVQAEAPMLLDLVQGIAKDAPEDVGVRELLAWTLHRSGDDNAASAVLEPIMGQLNPLIAAYRMGLITYGRGPSHYAQAKELLKTAKALRNRTSLFSTAHADMDNALRAIRDWERQQQRARKEAERAAAAAAKQG